MLETPASRVQPRQRRRLPGPLAAALIATIAVLAFSHWVPATIHRSDDYEYASIARNVLRGAGAATQHAYPIDVMLWGRLPHPDFMHPPGLAYLIALSFRCFGISDGAAVAPVAACFVLLAALVFRLADHLAGRGAAWCSVALVVLPVAGIGGSLLDLGTQALTEVPTALCVLVAVLLVVAQPRAARTAIGAGLAMATAQLLRENALLCLPGIAILVWASLDDPAGRPVRRRQILLLGGAAAVGVALLAARSWLVAGTLWQSYGPYSMQSFTAVYPGLDALRQVALDGFPDFLRAHTGAFATKVGVNLLKAARLLIRPPTVWALVWLAALRGPVSPGLRRLAIAIAVMAVAQIAALSTFTITARHLSILAPLGIVLLVGVGAEIVRSASARWGGRRRPLAIAAAIATGVAVVLLWRAPGALQTAALGRDARFDLQTWLAARTPTSAVVLSDFPEVALWRADRRGVWLPAEVEDADAVCTTFGVTHLLLTAERTPAWPAWQRIAETRSAAGWSLVATFDGVPHALLFERRP